MSLCECGCKQQTSLAPQTRKAQGWEKGKPLRFILGHGNRKHPHGWDEVDTGHETLCWIWRGATNAGGYAKRGTVVVHREMWEEENGPVPKGLELDHLCCQKKCVRPTHIEAVTHAENMRRSRVAKITPEIAATIRASTERSGILADRYGIGAHNVWAIRSGMLWRDTESV